MRILAAALGVALGVCILLLAPPPPERATALASYRIGDVVALPVLRDLDGHAIDLGTTFATAGEQAPAALVIEFWSARCPIARGYDQRVEALAADYRSRDVRVVAVTANHDERPAEIRARRDEQQTPNVPILIDASGRLAEQLGVDKTPHFVVLDAGGELVYSGALDSNLRGGGGKRRDYLRGALDATLSQLPVPVTETRVFGCPVRHQTHAAAGH
jgi:hypothetical protein